MKIQTVILSLTLGSNILLAGSYNEQMLQAEKLYKAKKYKEAAVAYEEAIIETEKSAERIKAKYGYFECLKHCNSGDKIAAAESLLYEEPELTPSQIAELIEYIGVRSQKERRDKAIAFGLQKKLSEYDRSIILMGAVNSGGAWDKWADEILAMKNPAPEARAVALGNVATRTLWGERKPQKALEMFNEALKNKELNKHNRQFFLLGKARCYFALKQYQAAEATYTQALMMGAQPDFQDAAYNELLSLYVRVTKQYNKIEPLLKQAAKDRNLRKKQRLIFVNALKEIEKRRNQNK